MEVTLVIVPGRGARRYPLNEGATLSDLSEVSEHPFEGRNIVVNGKSVPQSQWDTFQLSAGNEVFSTKAVKGA